jgi:hypothetical protein
MEDVRIRRVQVAFVEYIMLPAPSWHSSPGNPIPHYIPSASKQPLRLFSLFLSFQNKDCLTPVFSPAHSFLVMARFHFLLAFSQLTLVHGHPAGAVKRQSNGLGTAIDISSNNQATTSWSTAIEGLQSATAPAIPTITGVCTCSLCFPLHDSIN